MREVIGVLRDEEGVIHGLCPLPKTLLGITVVGGGGGGGARGGGDVNG